MASVARSTAFVPFTQWWRLRSHGERRLVASGVACVAALVVWLALLQPVERSSDRLVQQLQVQRMALAEAHRQVDDIAVLERNPSVRPVREAAAEVEAALTRAGIKAIAIDRIDSQRVRVTIDSIPIERLAGLLDSIQRDARLRAIDATATGRVEPGQVRAELTLGP